MISLGYLYKFKFICSILVSYKFCKFRSCNLKEMVTDKKSKAQLPNSEHLQRKVKDKDKREPI